MKPHKYISDSQGVEFKYRMYRLRNAEIDPARHVIYSADNYRDDMAVRFQGLSLQKHNKIRDENLLIPKQELTFTRIDDALCVPTHRNFYHMMVDCLPRLWATFAAPGQRVLICNNMLEKLPNIFPLIQDWLPVDQWLFTQVDEHQDHKGKPLRLNTNRVVGDLRFYSSMDKNLDTVFHRNKILAAAFWRKWYMDHHEDQPQSRRIFLARTIRKSGEKPGERCLNQQEIYQALPGFEWIDPYDHSLEELACIMDAAKVIVGVHGAALANILFCQPGTLLVQLNNHSGSDSIYERVAASMRMRHLVVKGYDPDTGGISMHNKGPGWHVDPLLVLDALKGQL